MRKNAPRFHWLGVIVVAAGLVAPLWAQQSGPIAPAPASDATAQQGGQQAAQQNNADSANQPPASAPIAPATTSEPVLKQRPATPTPADSSSSKVVEVVAGTHIPLVLHNAISTHSARVGDPVYFETLFPVMVDGRVAIPVGTYVSGEVTETKRPGRVKGRAELNIKLTEMILPNAYMVNLNATPSGSAGTGGGETTNGEGKIIGDSDKASDIGTVVKTTAAGAGIGGIASRTGEGAGIGAGIGAVAGLAAVLLSRGPEAELPRGSTLEAVIDRPIYLDADKVQFTTPGQASTLAGPPNREPVRQKVPF
jgi:hypothetical protein